RFGDEIQRDDSNEHENRTQKRVEKELDGSIGAIAASPNCDEEIHRNQGCFEEHIKLNQIERAEHSDHRRFQNEQINHELFCAVIHIKAEPHRNDTDECREQYQPKADTVNSHFERDSQLGNPPRCFVILKKQRVDVVIVL